MLESVSLTYRNAVPEDEGFLFELYASTRIKELDAWGWNNQQQEAFLKMQFQARQSSYKNQFPNSNYQIVLMHQLAVGEIRLADIALLPEYRDRGIGSFLIQSLLAEAARARKPLRLQVIQFNRALRLYQRLGFSKVSDRGVYFSMEWLPPAAAARR